MRVLYLTLFWLTRILAAEISQEVVGEVKLSFYFESLDGRLPNGQTCDPWPLTKCDVYFTICITSQGGRSCDLFYHQTKFSKDTHVGQAAITFPLKNPFPKSLDVAVEAWDQDQSSTPDSIARFRGNLILAEIPNTAAAFRMVREDVNFVNKVRLQSYGHIVCAHFFYGGDCSRKCIPVPERYACDMSGYKKCKRGFFGVECDLRDYCVDHTCAEFAMCKNTPSGFECWCEDSSGPQCHLGYNPCAPEHGACSGHGTCMPVGVHNISFRCTCDHDWEGQRCDQRRPACLVAIETNQTLCQNGGKCIDLKDKPGNYFCECVAGWWGENCETKTAVIYETTFRITVSVGTSLIFLAFVGFVLCVCFKKRSKSPKPDVNYMSSAQLPYKPSSTGSTSAELDCITASCLTSNKPFCTVAPSPPSSNTAKVPPSP